MEIMLVVLNIKYENIGTIHIEDNLHHCEKFESQVNNQDVPHNFKTESFLVLIIFFASHSIFLILTHQLFIYIYYSEK